MSKKHKSGAVTKEVAFAFLKLSDDGHTLADISRQFDFNYDTVMTYVNGKSKKALKWIEEYNHIKWTTWNVDQKWTGN